MWSEFKKFAFKGNVMDMAVGVMIGAAFNGIVSSIVNDVFMPLFGLIFDTTDLGTKFIVLKGVEGVDGDDEHDQRNNRGKAGRKHGNAVFLIHFHQFLIIHRLVARILLLQLLHLILIFFHLDVLLSHRHPLIDIEREDDKPQNDRKYDDADADDAYALDEDAD